MRLVENETRLTMNTRRNFVNYATMTLSDGTVLNLTPSDFRIAGNSFTDDWVDGESFQIGTAIGKTATILLDNTDGRIETIGTSTVTYPHGKFSEYNFYMAYFQLFVCLPEAYHYNGQLRDQMIPIGIFTVTTPTSHGATIEITGVDNMYLFDKSFDDCQLNFDAGQNLKTILDTCCNDCGVTIGYSNFTNQSIVITKRPEGTTYRQVVSWIAQIAGCNAVIRNTGALTLKSYDMSALDGLDGGSFNTTTTPYSDGDTADGGEFSPWNTADVIDGGDFDTPLGYHNLVATSGTSVSTDDIVFTGVLVSSEVNSAHYPNTEDWNTYAMTIGENPFVEGHESVIAESVFYAISGLKFRAFSCSSIQDPTIEAGDCAVVYDVKGNSYHTIITNVTFKTGGMTDVSCNAEPPVTQGSRYVSQAAYAIRQAENDMNEYNKQVAHFNELANEALGYYQTEEVDPQTGSTITYVHDSPALATSTIIWKITSTGIFISEDGGQSYNNGYDASTATMMMNLIYAHGITADWMKTGKLMLTGEADGITFEAYNYFYFLYQYNVTTSDFTVYLDEFENAYQPIVVVDNLTGSVIARLKYISSGTTHVEDIIALHIGENKFSTTVPARFSTKLGRLYYIEFDTSTGSFFGDVKAYHYAVDIRPNIFQLHGSFCDMYCYDFLADHLKVFGRVLADGATFDNSITAGGMTCKGTLYTQSSSYTVTFDPNQSQFACVRSDSKYVAWSGGSDRRLKENIREVSNDYIEQFFNLIEPVRFNYIGDKDNDYIGLVAQDLQETLDDVGLNNDNIVVTIPLKESGFVDNEEDNRLGIDYELLIGHLLAGVKDLYKQIDELKAEVEELKKK